MGTREKLVTKSDETFALLMYETLVNEKKQGNVEDIEDIHHEEDEDEQHEEEKDKQHDGDKQHEEGKETAQSVPGEKKTTTKPVRGKYTRRCVLFNLILRFSCIIQVTNERSTLNC